MTLTVVQVPNFVAPHDLKAWTNRIVRSRHSWRSCFGGEYSTFGVAWYVEIEQGCPAQYHAAAQEWNSRLRTFENLRKTISRIAALLPKRAPAVPRRTILGPYWADYGFTVYHRHGDSGSPHTDLEGLIPYPAAMFDPGTEAYSAVVAITCPASGGGLWVDVRGRRIGSYEAPPTRRGWKLYSYKPGTLTIFDSFLPHAIQASRMSQSSAYRIVLAVHFLYRDEPFPHYQYWF